MISINNVSCCGVGDVRLNSTSGKVALKELYQRMFNRSNFYSTPTKKAFYLLTNTERAKNLKDMVAIITKNELGTIVGVPAKKNPNSRNKIVAYLYSPDEKKLKAYYKKEEAAEKLRKAKQDKKKAEIALKKANEAIKKLKGDK